MSERVSKRVSRLKDAQPPLPSTLLTYSSIFRLFVQHLQEVFFLPVPYFILLSVNIAMMILNFFTRRLLIVLARTHSVRSKPYSYQKNIPSPTR